MTPSQFNEQYQLLAKHIPWQFGSQESCNTLSKAVADLSYAWFQKVVAHILLNHAKGNYNIGADIKSEKTRLAQEFSTNENAKDQEQMKQNATGLGLEAMKKRHNITGTAWDLVVVANGLRKGKGA